jgi:hypothetical protein
LLGRYRVGSKVRNNKKGNNKKVLCLKRELLE